MNPEAPPAVEAVNLTRCYGSITAVDNISFRIGRGEIVGFLGPNGAGKSTTLRMLCTSLRATRGHVRIDGHDAFRDSLAARRTLGYLPESNPLPPEMRVGEYLRFRARLKRAAAREAVDSVLEDCGLAEVRRRIIGQLSLGFRKRVGLADALVGNPGLLILDEPGSGLDPNQRQEVERLVRAQAGRRTVMLSTHILPEASRICQRVLILHRGRLLADESTESLRQRFSGTVRVEVEAPPEQALDRFRALSSDARAHHEGSSPPFHLYRIEAPGGEDLRTTIADLARRCDWRLRELTRRQGSLEEIFARLTREA